ncbi:MAG: hypothetical protein KDA32_12850, partial [Phycisphaerales bacterium]|nr:hypothetical protein [Phycisphaerales bacterium]
LLMGQSGTLRFLEFGAETRSTPIRLTGVRPFWRRTAPDDLRLATSADGGVSAMQLGSRLWLFRRGQSRPIATRWSNRQTPVLRNIAMSDDGKLLALHSRTAVGDAQSISFARIDADKLMEARPARFALTQDSRVRIVGSTIRAFDFFPDSENLLVARANGELLLISPSADGADAPDPYVWLTLDGAPAELAFDSGGSTLAVATDDGAVRLFSTLDTSPLGVIRLPDVVSSMSFSPDGDILLLRLTNGSLLLYDLDSLTLVANWDIKDGSERPIAAWVGDGGGMLIAENDRVWLYEQARVDAALRRDSNFAGLNRARAQIQENDFRNAWHTVATALSSDAPRRQAALLEVAIAALRRRGATVPDAWLETVCEGAAPCTVMALGDAAYAGERFDLAFQLLRRASVSLNGALDAYTAWRLAECAYLLDDYRYASDTIGVISRRNDFHPTDLPRATIERVSALRMMDSGAAESVLDASLQSDVSPEFLDPVANMATEVIGKYLLGRQGESQFLENVRAVLSVFADRWLYYLDDVQFFTGETARARGATTDARSRYLDCIDLSRDTWPANWARYRVNHLDAAPRKPVEEHQ